MNTEQNFQWTDDLVKEFAAYAVRERISWAVVTDASAAPVPFDILQKQFVDKRTPKQQPNKDWEIISFYCNGKLFELEEPNSRHSDRGYYNLPHQEKSINTTAYNPKYGDNIHSVKRLSDGEVFTVGDDIEHMGIIAEFEIAERFGGGLAVKHFGSSTAITVARKVNKKLPLFKTENNKEIFEGDRVWFVNQYLEIDFYDFIKVHGQDGEALKHYPEKYKYFSTEGEAQNYVDIHKPKYTEEDMRKCFEAAQVKYSQLNPLSPTGLFEDFKLKSFDEYLSKITKP